MIAEEGNLVNKIRSHICWKSIYQFLSLSNSFFSSPSKWVLIESIAFTAYWIQMKLEMYDAGMMRILQCMHDAHLGQTFIHLQALLHLNKVSNMMTNESNNNINNSTTTKN